jgi:fructokinase
VRHVVVIGEALVDLVESNCADGDQVYKPRYGGSPLNVAVGVARLGAPVVLSTALGNDSFGQRLRSFLVEEGVRVQSSPDSTIGTCLAVGTRRDGGIDYEYFGNPDSMLDVRSLDPLLVQNAAVVHAGSTALLDGPVMETVTEAFGVQGPYKTIDPNPRPRLISDRWAYRDRIQEFMASVDLVKLSREDADYLFPGMTTSEVAEAVLTLGPSVVLVTTAESDTAVATRDGFRMVKVAEIEVVDPTGAGDSFMASTLRDISQIGVPQTLDEWETLASRANVAASLTCSSLGGADSMPTSSELDARLRAGVISARP